MEIAVLVPCYNEELTVEKVISDFNTYLPEAKVYVYDNNSTDNTYELAVKSGAIVKKELRQGKGNVVRSMFRDIDADVYIMIDGDDTYPVEEIRKLIEPVAIGDADMVIGDRLSNGTYAAENKRGFHNFGNNLVRNLINRLFDGNINDIMTGYRVFNRTFVKTMPVMSEGFQIETELSIFSLVNRFKIVEIPIIYRDRPEGSVSKLNTFKDGFKVLLTLFNLYKDYKPLWFFTIFAVMFGLLGLLTGIPVIVEFSLTGLVAKLPSAVLASSLFILSFLCFFLGLILDYSANQSKKNFEMFVNDFIYRESKEK